MLAACATPTSWQRAGAAPDEVSFDLQGCRSETRARMQSDLYYARERAHYDARRAAAVGNTGTAVFDRWQEFSERRNFDDLVGECMTRKGYRLAPAPHGDRAA
jgi:hypothetical protein